MASMRQQPITDDSLSEAEALHLVRGLSLQPRIQRQDSAVDRGTQRAVLTRTFEEEVIPRLVLARRATGSAPDAPDLSDESQSEEIGALLKLVLEGSEPQAREFVQSRHEQGVTAESLFLDLISPTARRLGVMWEDDECSFSDVTIGVMRLANVMRLISHAFDKDFNPDSSAPRALLLQAPGEQHGLGLAMVVHFFRRAGWNVRSVPVASSRELLDLVKADWYGVIGLSVACNERLDALAADIRAIRRVSRNRDIGVMVGGPPFLAHPQLAAMVGADATAADGRTAVQRAQSLISLLAHGR